MNERLKNKWIAVCLIWGGVILMSVYNFYKIDQIKADIFENQILKMDRMFLKTQAEKIDRIFDEEARLYQKIESVGIGILVVENQLRKMAESYDLADMRLEARSENNGGDNLPLKLFVSGTLPDMVALLMQIKKEAPYLTANQIEWSNDIGNSKIQFHLRLSYRYIIADKEQGA